MASSASVRATSWASVRSWLQARQPIRLAQTLVVAGHTLGDHRAPDLEGPTVEPVPPAAVVQVARYEHRLGPLVRPSLIELGPVVAARLVVVEPQARDDESGTEPSRRSTARARRPERVRREVEAEQVADEQVDGDDRERDRQHRCDRDADDDDPLLAGLVGAR